MKQTFTVLVYLKTSKINSKGMAPICIRVTVNGKRSEISIKQFIEPSRWNSNRQRLTGSIDDYEIRAISYFFTMFVCYWHFPFLTTYPIDLQALVYN